MHQHKNENQDELMKSWLLDDSNRTGTLQTYDVRICSLQIKLPSSKAVNLKLLEQ